MKRIVWGVGIASLVIAGAIIMIRGGAVPVEMGAPVTTTVREYIAEDARTRLANEYTVDMPISGTADRIAFEIGDHLEQGQTITHIDAYPIEQRIKEVQALIAEAQAHVSGVDIAKPKQEDIEAARIRITEMKDSVEIAHKARAVVEYNQQQASKSRDRAKALLDAGAASQLFYDEALLRYNGLTEGLSQSKLEEEAAQKALDQTELAYQRLSGSIDDNEYLRAAYLAQVEGLQAQVAVLKNDLQKTEVKAPVSGPILEKFIDDQRVLVAGTPLLKIGDLQSIEIESDILSEEITAVREGNTVEITGKALRGKTLTAVVTRIYPAGFKKISSLGIEQQRVRTIIGFDNSEARLRPGTSIDVKVITAEAVDTLAVPDRAIFRQNGEWAVFKVVGGKAHITPITIGLRNDDWVEVRDGLTPDDTIITELKNELADGGRVVPLD